MPRRCKASARLGPTPLRNFTGLVRVRMAISRLLSAFCSFAHQPMCIAYRIEELEIVEGFPRAQEAYRCRHRAAQWDHAAALRRAVELRNDEPSERNRGSELLRLVHGVLPNRDR